MQECGSPPAYARCPYLDTPASRLGSRPLAEDYVSHELLADPTGPADRIPGRAQAAPPLLLTHPPQALLSHHDHHHAQPPPPRLARVRHAGRARDHAPRRGRRHGLVAARGAGGPAVSARRGGASIRRRSPATATRRTSRPRRPTPGRPPTAPSPR